VEWLSWAPAWLLSFSFGIAGDLSGWLHEQKLENRPSGESPRYWLVRTASGALSSYALDPHRFEQHHPEAWPDFGNGSLFAVRNLLNRSMFVWLALLAVLAIMGFCPDQGCHVTHCTSRWRVSGFGLAHALIPQHFLRAIPARQHPRCHEKKV